MATGSSTQEAQAKARLGSTVAGKWKLERLVGLGSMGAVYEAQDKLTKQRVAVKLLHPTLATSEEHVVRFLREARAASTVGHPGIVRVLDAGRQDEGKTIYLVLELLTGETLDAWMERGGLQLKTVLDIAAQLLDALAAAHARAIVHRDIKPENVFLIHDARSGRHKVKLLDFGVAKHLIKHGGRSSWDSMDGLIVGTPHYMSPEQCRGAPVDARTDLWSTGAMIFHALAGQPPFDAEHLADLLTRIVTTRAPSLAKFRKDLPPNVIRVVDRALEPLPEQRWPTAQQMADELGGRGAPIGDLDWDD